MAGRQTFKGRRLNTSQICTERYKEKAAASNETEKTRVCPPRKSINKVTNEHISDQTIWRIFKSMCCDEKEDDAWQFLPSPEQDCLTEEMKPKRVNTANHVMNNITESAAWNFVAIDPCISLLPKKQSKAEEMQIAAMGHKKWMSKKPKRKGVNLRAPNTAKTQIKDCAFVPWTPVFTRGRVKLVVLTQVKAKLNSADKVADFVISGLHSWEVFEELRRNGHHHRIPCILLL